MTSLQNHRVASSTLNPYDDKILVFSFVSHREELKLKYKGANPEERNLFHGTRTEDASQSICFQGFDPRIHSVTGVCLETPFFNFATVNQALRRFQK